METRVLTDTVLPSKVGGCQRQRALTQSHAALSRRSEPLELMTVHWCTLPSVVMFTSISTVPCSPRRTELGGEGGMVCVRITGRSGALGMGGRGGAGGAGGCLGAVVTGGGGSLATVKA